VQRVESDAEDGRGLKGDVESGEESAGRRAKRSEAHILECPSTVGRGQEGHVTWARGESRLDSLPTGEPRVSDGGNRSDAGRGGFSHTTTHCGAPCRPLLMVWFHREELQANMTWFICSLVRACQKVLKKVNCSISN